MVKKKITDLIRRAFDLGFQQGFEIACRTPIDKTVGKDEFKDIVLDTAINSLESAAFKSISAELDIMNEQFPEFNWWRVFSDGASQNFSERTGNKK